GQGAGSPACPVPPPHAVDDCISVGSLNGHGRRECRDGKSAQLEHARGVPGHPPTPFPWFGSFWTPCRDASGGSGSATGDWAQLGCLNCPNAEHLISTTSTRHRPAFARSLGAKEPKLVPIKD